MKNLSKVTRYTSLAAAVYMASTGLAMAQQAQQQDNKLEEIVVQAERRTTDLQKTAVSVTAMNEKKIAELGVTNTRELAAFVPNLQVESGFAYGDINPSINIRGVGGGNATGSFGISTEKAVGIYIDGIYYGRQFGSIINVTDFEAVEVLLGPQGTLFGRNSIGGAITYRTKKATTDGFNGYVEAKVGSFGRREIKAAVNVPINDQWATRMAAANNLADGHVKRGSTHMGNTNEQNFNISVRGKPNDKLTIDAAVTYTQFKNNGNAQILSDITLGDDRNLTRRPTWMVGAIDQGLRNKGQPGLVNGDNRIAMGGDQLPDFCLVDGDGDVYTRANDYCDTYRRGKTKLFTFKATYDHNQNIRVSYLSGVIDGYVDSRNDAFSLGVGARDFRQDFRSAQNEVQLNLNYDKWNAVGGLIHFAEKGKEYEYTREAGIRDPGGVSAPLPGNPFASIPNPVPDQNQIIIGNRRDEHYRMNTNSWAAYTQATYSVLPTVDVTGGLRYSSDAKIGSYELRPTQPRNAAGAIESFRAGDYRNTLTEGRNKWTATDFRLAVQWSPTKDVMLYWARTKAYKAGMGDDASAEQCGNPSVATATRYPTTAVNANGQSLDPTWCDVPGDRAVGPITWVKPENVISNEVGIRSEWFDQRFRANFSFFQERWRDRQVGSTVTIDNNTVFVTINDNPIKTKGFEAQLTWNIVKDLTATYNYGYTVAKQTYLAERLTLPRDQNLVGTTARYILDNTAPYNWTAGLRHNWQFGNGDRLTTSWNYTFRKGVTTFNVDENRGGQRTEGNSNPDYKLINMNFAYMPKGGKWDASLGITNLMNTRFTFGRYNLGGGAQYFGNNDGNLTGLQAIFLGGPRALNLTGRYYF